MTMMIATGSDLDDGFVENCDEDFEKEESESFLPRSALAKSISFHLIKKMLRCLAS